MNKVAFWGIFIIPILWGVGFPLTHNAVQNIHPGVFAFYRQLVAVLIVLPFALYYLKDVNKRTLFGGIVLGILGVFNVVGQSYALVTLSSSTTAFLVTLNILFVPFLLLIFKISKISAFDIISILLGILSIYITFEGKIPGIESNVLYGFLAAISIASTIVFIEYLTKQHSINKILLSFISLLTATVLLSVFPITMEYNIFSNTNITSDIIIAIIYQGSITTALALYLQIKYQKEVGGVRTGIILNLDLVFASLFGLVNNELLSIYQIIGGLLALVAATIHEMGNSIKSTFIKIFKKWKK